MSTKFWACFSCGAHIAGTAPQILDFSKNHMCQNIETTRENVTKIVKVLRGIQSSLSARISLPTPIKSVNFIESKYKKNEIYTLVGNVLIAVNPNKNIDGIYSNSTIKKYYKYENLSPHLYSIANEARQNVLNQSQSIIITVESGAGKTETTKHIIRFLSDTANDDLMEVLNHAGTVLDAFGNASTHNNVNSSRYAKFVQIHYGQNHDVIGAEIRHFMLEKSHILDYHIFGGLLNASQEIKSFLKLDDPLFASNDRNVPKSLHLDKIDNALDRLLPQKKYAVYQFIGGIYSLSKISFEIGLDDNCCMVSQMHPVELASRLLSIDSQMLSKALTTRLMNVPGENAEEISMPLNVLEAERARDALIKAIYSNLHHWIVGQINRKIEPKKSIEDQINESQHYIGILDMPGYECFTVNKFEQLMINYSNETIQKFCIENVMKEEFVSNNFHHTDVIDLIGSSKNGILTLLDDETKLQASSNFSEIVQKHWPSCSALSKDKLLPSTFTIRHYAGQVTYRTENFVEANVEAISEGILKIAEICLRNVTNTEISLERLGKRLSEGYKLRQELEALLGTLKKNKNHFVRCIKANDIQKFDLFDTKCVERQLTTTGTDVLIENEVNLWQFGEKKTNESESDENEDEPPTKVAKKSSEGPTNPTKTNSLRYDRYDHWVLHDDFQSGSRCKNNKCNKTIHTYCSKCNTYLCSIRDRNCFKDYHHRK